MTMPGHLQFGMDEAHTFGIDPNALRIFDGETKSDSTDVAKRSGKERQPHAKDKNCQADLTGCR